MVMEGRSDDFFQIKFIADNYLLLTLLLNIKLLHDFLGDVIKIILRVTREKCRYLLLFCDGYIFGGREKVYHNQCKYLVVPPN